jgi:peptide/nickel transport system ATP-binding protein
VVGQSGSGKTTLVRCILGLERFQDGRVLWDGQPLNSSTRRDAWRAYQQLQVIWQDPHSYLNPYRTCREIILEPVGNFMGLSGEQARRLLDDILAAVRLEPEVKRKHPHELSGGQAQRVAIARALILHPRVLICDEPFSALDLPLQWRLMDLLAVLRRERGLSLLFVSHDLAMVSQLCEEVMVMDRGRVVEYGPVGHVLQRPGHEATRRLLDAAI